jgi:hypothetical protein
MTKADSRADARTASAFALYNPTTKHDWMSRTYAREKLAIYKYCPLLPEDKDSESAIAIGQVEVYWACYELSPYKQKATFLIAPKAQFDVLFGYETESIQRGSWKKAIQMGKLKVVKGDHSRDYQDTFHQQGYCEGLECEMSFKRGIENGTLIPVDNERGDAAHRPSIADLEQYHKRASTGDALENQDVNAGQLDSPDIVVETSGNLSVASEDPELNLRTRRQELRDESVSKRRRSALFEALEVDSVPSNPEDGEEHSNSHLQSDGNVLTNLSPPVDSEYGVDLASSQSKTPFGSARPLKGSRAADIRSPGKRHYTNLADVETTQLNPAPSQGSVGTSSPPRRRRGNGRTARRPVHSKDRSIDSSSNLHSSLWLPPGHILEIPPTHESHDSQYAVSEQSEYVTTPVYAMAQGSLDHVEPLTLLTSPTHQPEPMTAFSRSTISRRKSLPTTSKQQLVSDQDLYPSFHTRAASTPRIAVVMEPENKGQMPRSMYLSGQQHNDHTDYYTYDSQHHDSHERDR